jgi:hypothetical protein
MLPVDEKERFGCASAAAAVGLPGFWVGIGRIRQRRAAALVALRKKPIPAKSLG